jgi:hypothetical protein
LPENAVGAAQPLDAALAADAIGQTFEVMAGGSRDPAAVLDDLLVPLDLLVSRAVPLPRLAPPGAGGPGRGTQVEEVTDEPLYRDRVCGIDIGKAAMAATIRVPSDKNPVRRRRRPARHARRSLRHPDIRHRL